MQNKVIDASICNNLKYTEITEIQPHGVLLVLDAEDGKILQCSNNLTTVFGTSIEELHNSNIEQFIKADGDADSIFYKWLNNPTGKTHKAFWKNKEELCPVWINKHQSADHIYLEIESYKDYQSDHDIHDLFEQLTQIRLLTQAPDLHTLAKAICDQIQGLVNFDRVSVYKFNDDKSGIVMGEAVKPNMESFLNVRFPATDVPPIVHLAFLKQPLRYIPTIDYKAAKLVNICPHSQKNFDYASYLILRPVVPVHLEYIKNMGANSATSVAIIHNNKLWGIIACQHRVSKYLSPNDRIFLTLFANTISQHLSVFKSQQRDQHIIKTTKMQAIIIQKIINNPSLTNALEELHPAMLEMMTCNGMTICWQGQIDNFGITPSHIQIKNLMLWLNKNHLNKVFYTQTLPQLYEEAMTYKECGCGILAIPFDKSKQNYLLFFRSEQLYEEKWAGNPNETIVKHELNETGYSPRDSFKQWLQTVSNVSLSWRDYEILAGKFLRSIISNKQLQSLLEKQAKHDLLTGALNRHTLSANLKKVLSHAQIKDNSIVILLLDIDHFKNYNDTYGHSAGDEILIKFANCIQHYLGANIDLYRYGGEEFLIILQNKTLPESENLAELLRKKVSALNIYFDDKLLPKMTVSIGIAQYPEDCNNMENLINNADKALYAAKNMGRNQIVTYSKLSH